MVGLLGYLAAGAAEGAGTGIFAKAKALREERLAELERGFTLQRDRDQREFTAAENEKNRQFQRESQHGDLIDLGGGKYGVRKGARVEPLTDGEGNAVSVNVPSGYRQLTPDEVKAAGLDPSKGYQVATSGADKGKISQIGGGGTTVHVGSDGAPGLGKLSTDYGYVLDPATGKPRIDPESGLPMAAAIPGSPAAMEAEKEAREARQREETQAGTNLGKAETMLDATKAIKELVKEAGPLGATGTTSRLPAMLSSTAAGKVRSYVGTLKSGVALGAIMRLKEASATGATGFGSMNEKELQLLIDDVGALDPDTTDPEIFMKTIDRIEERFKRVVADVKRNVSPERIKELGLEPLISSMDQSGDLPEGVTEADIQFTMKKHGLTRDQVLERLNANGSRSSGASGSF